MGFGNTGKVNVGGAPNPAPAPIRPRPSLAPEALVSHPALTVVQRSSRPLVTADLLIDRNKCFVDGVNGFSIVLANQQVTVYDHRGESEAAHKVPFSLLTPILFRGRTSTGQSITIVSTKGHNPNCTATYSPNDADHPDRWRWNDLPDAQGAIAMKRSATFGTLHISQGELMFSDPTLREPLYRDSQFGFDRIGDNFFLMKSGPGVDDLYYTKKERPKKITKVSLSEAANGNPPAAIRSELVLQEGYASLAHLSAVGHGTKLLIAEADGNVVFIDSTTGHEVARVPNFYHLHYDTANNQIKGFDGQGYLVVCTINIPQLTAIQSAAAQVRNLAKVDIGALVADERGQVERIMDQTLRAQLATRQGEIYAQFLAPLSRCTTLAAINQVETQIAKAKADLIAKHVAPEAADILLEMVTLELDGKKKAVIATEMRQKLDLVENILVQGISMTSIVDIQTKMNEISTNEQFLDQSEKGRLQGCELKLQLDIHALYQRATDEIRRDLDSIHNLITTRLTAIGSNQVAFDRWCRDEWPVQQRRLRAMQSSCPIGAVDAYKFIQEAIEQSEQKVNDVRLQFDRVAEAARLATVGHEAAMIATTKADIKMFLTHIGRQQFSDVAHGQAWVSQQAEYLMILDSIAGLKQRNPARADELERELLTEVASALDRKQRMQQMTVNAGSHRMIRFGQEDFPVWEQPLVQAPRATMAVNVVFAAEPNQTGVRPDDRIGKIVLVTSADGKDTATIDMWKDAGRNADSLRMGASTYRGAEIPASIMSVADYKKFKADLTDWNRGTVLSALRLKEHDLRMALHALHDQRKSVVPGSGLQQMDDAWKARYQAAYDELAKFCSEHHIALLRHIDRVRAQTKVGNAPKKLGGVPEWQPHWVLDGDTENILEQMAVALKMQSRLKEGLLNLKGHAGTGKDVLVKMFCSLAQRPYFAFDCSKWTTEYELAEDVQLVAVDGVTTTVKVPSAVLAAITTPGGVCYFNEFNAMPEQSQIFLHALFDEKRSMTIKTRSGATIKAEQSVLFVSSMNPGYPGTFPVQFATKSRTVSLEVGYPAEKSGGRYSSTEAWRIARGVESLFRHTLTGDSSNNDFVKIWNREMNNDTAPGTPPVDKVEEFDLKVVAALVQFGNKLRAEFMRHYDKSARAPGGAKPLLVTQPLTGREMRRFADRLNQIPEAEKLTGDPEKVARELIYHLFLTHIDNITDRISIWDAMSSWTVDKL
jgi:hypothetical protein